MRPWTVIALYPQDIANQYGESYMTAVKADSPELACAMVRDEMVRELLDYDIQQSPEGIKVVCCVEGDHQDQTPARFR
jgi:hypothetical protein